MFDWKQLARSTAAATRIVIRRWVWPAKRTNKQTIIIIILVFSHAPIYVMYMLLYYSLVCI